MVQSEMVLKVVAYSDKPAAVKQNEVIFYWQKLFVCHRQQILKEVTTRHIPPKKSLLKADYDDSVDSKEPSEESSLKYNPLIDS